MPGQYHLIFACIYHCNITIPVNEITIGSQTVQWANTLFATALGVGQGLKIIEEMSIR